MSQRTPVRAAPPVDADARNRAWRTLGQGLAVDVAVAVVAALSVAVSDIHWTREYWVALAGLLAKTIITSVVSYLARTLMPPPSV